MKLLGIRICDHDSNLSFYDGNTVRYLKTERFFQIKHRGEQNLNSWKRIISKTWGVNYKDIDQIGIVFEGPKYNLPFPNYTQLASNYFNFPEFENVINLNHHYAHSLSYWPLDITPDVSIVIDGQGDPDETFTVFKNNKVIDKGSNKLHGSLGIEMIEAVRAINSNNSTYIEFTKTRDLDIPGKLMGLQSYGKIDQTFLNFLNQFDLYSIKECFNFEHWYNYKQDHIISDLTKLDWLATVHEAVGNILVKFFTKHCSPQDTIFYSGGVAQNVIWNTKLKSYFPNLHILPHCADDGLSLGIIEHLRKINNLPKLPLKNFPYSQSDEKPITIPTLEIIKKTAKLLYQGYRVGWYQGNGEIGPRALGNRSILFNPLIKDGKNIINQIKKRENYRPFGASVLWEKAYKHFENPIQNPYMLYVSKVIDSRLKNITHIDGTCRIQTVTEEQNPHYYKLIQEFEKLSGIPILLNTSLNVNGKPIAAYEDDAYELFYNSELDYLVIGNEIISK